MDADHIFDLAAADDIDDGGVRIIRQDGCSPLAYCCGRQIEYVAMLLANPPQFKFICPVCGRRIQITGTLPVAR